DLRVGMSSEDWIWLDGEDDCLIERLGPVELRATGRLYCTLPQGPRREWTEPFAAKMSHSPTASELIDYAIWFGNRATLLNLPKVQQLIESGEELSPPAPAQDDDWAFVFRMGDRT